MHRTIGETVEESIAEFKKTEKFDAGWYTGGVYPYHFFIGHAGVYQCLPIGRIGPAALRKLNETGIHVALSGDFRQRMPTPQQLAQLKELLVDLMNCFNGEVMIVGHTEDVELANLKGSKDPSKVCPGKYLDMYSLRLYVHHNLTNLCELSPEDGLKRHGFAV